MGLCASYSANSVIPGLTTAVALGVPLWLGPEASVISPRPMLRKHSHSFIFDYPVRIGGRKEVLLVKVQRRPEMQFLSEAVDHPYMKEIGTSEYDVLYRTWNAFSKLNDPCCTAIQPLAYLETWNAIVMLHIRAKQLKDIIFQPRVALGSKSPLTNLVSLMGRVAQWLRLYHENVGELQLKPFPQAEMETRLEGLLASLKKHSRGAVNVEILKERLEKKMNLADRLAITSILHGDYQSSNVLVLEDGRICSFDPRSLERRGPVYEDLATLLVDLDTRPLQILTGGQYLNPEIRSRCRQMILDTYFNGVPVSCEMVDLYAAFNVLHKWTMNERRLSGGQVKKSFGYPILLLMRRRMMQALNRYL